MYNPPFQKFLDPPLKSKIIQRYYTLKYLMRTWCLDVNGFIYNKVLYSAIPESHFILQKIVQWLEDCFLFSWEQNRTVMCYHFLEHASHSCCTHNRFVLFAFHRSDSGFQLLVCSWDGTVAYADFTAEEVGRPMSEEEKVFLTIQRSLLPSAAWSVRPVQKRNDISS